MISFNFPEAQTNSFLNRVPLLMGAITGRWLPETKLEAGDPRAQWFEHEEFQKLLACTQQLEPYLSGDGRTILVDQPRLFYTPLPVA